MWLPWVKCLWILNKKRRGGRDGSRVTQEEKTKQCHHQADALMEEEDKQEKKHKMRAEDTLHGRWKLWMFLNSDVLDYRHSWSPKDASQWFAEPQTFVLGSNPEWNILIITGGIPVNQRSCSPLDVHDLPLQQLFVFITGYFANICMLTG